MDETQHPAVRPEQHGTVTGYSYGCRCERCRVAKEIYRRTEAAKVSLGVKESWRQRVKKSLDPQDKRHATANGYLNYGCRCEPCKHAHKVWKRKRVVGGHLTHGTQTGYAYGCKCDKCKVANKAYRTERELRLLKEKLQREKDSPSEA